MQASAAPYEERLHAAPEGTASHDERPAQQAHLPDRRVLQRQHKSFREFRHRHVHRAAWSAGAAAVCDCGSVCDCEDAGCASCSNEHTRSAWRHYARRHQGRDGFSEGGCDTAQPVAAQPPSPLLIPLFFFFLFPQPKRAERGNARNLRARRHPNFQKRAQRRHLLLHLYTTSVGRLKQRADNFCQGLTDLTTAPPQLLHTTSPRTQTQCRALSCALVRLEARSVRLPYPRAPTPRCPGRPPRCRPRWRHAASWPRTLGTRQRRAAARWPLAAAATPERPEVRRKQLRQ